MTIDEVVETIAARCGIKLQPDYRSHVKKLLDRLFITIKEISLFK